MHVVGEMCAFGMRSIALARYFVKGNFMKAMFSNREQAILVYSPSNVVSAV